MHTTRNAVMPDSHPPHSADCACQLIIDPPLPGPWNMAVDEALLQSAANDGIATLRLYEWAEPTLSLGYFQRYEDRHQHAASRGAAIVRRQSGGGAILHDRELTYSLTLPPSHPLVRHNQRLYTAVHQVIIDLLSAMIGRHQTKWRLGLQNQEITGNGGTEPFLCFERRARGDLVLVPLTDTFPTNDPLPPAGNWKILGSAQRRRQGAILQHGSFLVARSSAAPELPGLADVLRLALDVVDLANRLPDLLADELGLKVYNSKLSNEMRQMVSTIEARKYGHAAWTNRR